MAREIRAFDYVNHPYEAVRDAIKSDAASIFRKATTVAQERGGELVASLSIDVQGMQISKDISIHLGAIREEDGPRLSRVTHVELEWQAKDAPGLFPVMKADLALYPLSATETQIDLTGQYDPPMGLLGSALDAVAGHRVAEACVHSFVTAVAERLRKGLPSK